MLLPAFSSFPTMFSKAVFLQIFNSLPDEQFLDWSKLKAFADSKRVVTEKKKETVLEMVENIVEKGENASYQHFSFSHNIFKRLHFQGH